MSHRPLAYRARETLARLGLVDYPAFVRASDVRFLSNPFLYYLIRRLGIVQPWGGSIESRLGTYFHMHQEESPEETFAEHLSFLSASIGALRHAGASITTDRAAEILSHARTLFDITKIWADAYRNLIEPYETGQYKVLAREITIACYPYCPGLSGYDRPARATPKNGYKTVFNTLPFVLDTPIYDYEYTVDMPMMASQVDAVVLDQRRNEIWYHDYKTTGRDPTQRALIIPSEPQTKFYMYLGNKRIMNIFKPGATFAGVRHFVLPRPPLPSTRQDRPLLRYWSQGTRKKTSGTATPIGNAWVVAIRGEDGRTEERQYETEDQAVAALHEATGKKPEPIHEEGAFTIEAYRKRAMEWFMSPSSPRPLVSETVGVLQKEEIVNLLWIVGPLAVMAGMRNPCPLMYPSTQVDPHDPYVPFFFAPYEEWPRIMAQGGFVTHHRDMYLYYSGEPVRGSFSDFGDHVIVKCGKEKPKNILEGLDNKSNGDTVVNEQLKRATNKKIASVSEISQTLWSLLEEEKRGSQ